MVEGMAMESPWTVSSFAATLLMWTVMMALMMLPSSIPMLRTVVFASRGANSRGERETPVAFVAFGYVLAWTAFSAGASVVQLWLSARMLLSGNMALTDARVAAAVLIGAGAYQFTLSKAVCRSCCWSWSSNPVCVVDSDQCRASVSDQSSTLSPGTRVI